jgi:uncharacterized repeat protein (TIGR04042 family)
LIESVCFYICLNRESYNLITNYELSAANYQSPITNHQLPMPQINFQISWPDGSEQTCYSPSLIVKEYFAPDVEYKLDEFVESARTALNIASDRVKAKYGRPCGLAIGQLQDIEARASEYKKLENPKVKFIRFIE